VITGPAPVLYDCFNRADVLISDISSVVSDFIASAKPYVVTNLDGLDEDAFRENFPTAAAAYLLGPDCKGLSKILAQAVAPGDDRLAQARRELKTYLLGPDSPDAQTRFEDAVEALAERMAKSAVPDEALHGGAPPSQAVGAAPTG
jgi:CDP-glycerol glycerophosphotransferase (TagB/SpsB family)